MPLDLPGPDAAGHGQGVLDGEGVMVHAGDLHGQQPAGVGLGRVETDGQSRSRRRR